VADLEEKGHSTVEEIAKDLKARTSDVRAACGSLVLAGAIARGERARQDGKAGRCAITYGPAEPVIVGGTDRSIGGGMQSNGTDRSEDRGEKDHVVTTRPNLSVPNKPIGSLPGEKLSVPSDVPRPIRPGPSGPQEGPLPDAKDDRDDLELDPGPGVDLEGDTASQLALPLRGEAYWKNRERAHSRTDKC